MKNLKDILGGASEYARLLTESKKPPTLGCSKCYENCQALIGTCNTMAPAAQDVLDIVETMVKCDMPNHLDISTSAHLDIWTSAHLDIATSAHLDISTSEHLLIWTSARLNI